MKSLVVFAVVGGLAGGAAQALPVFNLSDTVTNVNSTLAVTPGSGQTAGIAPTQSFGISDAFNSSPPIGADFSAVQLTNQTNGPWNFYDDYVFSVASGANVQAALISFSAMFEGITNLQARIIQANGVFDPMANLNAPASGSVVVDAWLNTSPADGINTVNLSKTPFGAGTYDLQIRGEVAGGNTPSGGYGGTITFTQAVPLPAALPLLLPALSLLAAGRRRRVSV